MVGWMDVWKRQLLILIRCNVAGQCFKSDFLLKLA